MTTVVRSGFIVRHRLYALVGLLSLRQFPVHWERNENSMQFRKPIVWVDTVAGRIGVRPIVLRKQRLAKLKGEPPPSVPFVSASARIPKSEALSVKEIGGAHCIAGFRKRRDVPKADTSASSSAYLPQRGKTNSILRVL